jgi:endonuclease-3
MIEEINRTDLTLARSVFPHTMRDMDKQPIVDSISDFPRRAAKYPPVAAILREVYGYPDWRAFASDPVDELVSCILSQSTTDINTERGFRSLKARFPNWEAVIDAPTPDVVDAIRIAGLANQKGPRIQEVLRFINRERGIINIDFLADLPLEEAKAWLTQMNGVGPKTAAIVLCFAFHRPAFPVDTHVHRVGQRIGWLPEGISAEKAHDVMEAIVPPDDHLVFHLNLIRHGREICIARFPRCMACPLTEHCDYYKSIRELKTNGE